jgi:hypothetical protein
LRPCSPIGCIRDLIARRLAGRDEIVENIVQELAKRNV